MLIVDAVAKSAAVTLPVGAGEVVYKGERAIHIAVGDALLAVAKAGEGLPFGIEVSYTTDWMALPLAVGDAAIWRRDRVTVGASLTVTAIDACRTYAHRVEMTSANGITRETVDALCALAPAKALPEPVEAVLRERGSRIDDAMLTRLADGLIGRGRGSTPAGDDFLSGLYGALLLGGMAWDAARARLACEMRARLDRTTRLSRAYLTCLLAGCWHAGVADFLRAAQRASPLLERRAKTLLSYGHSSGSDFLQGFLFGGQRIAPHMERRMNADEDI